MKKIVGMTGLLLLLLTGCTKTNVNKDELLKDYTIFQSIYEQANPSIYKFHSKKEMDSVFVVNRQKITDSTTYRDFFNLVQNVVGYTESLHSAVQYDEFTISWLARKNILFPLPVKYTNGHLYAVSNYKGIPLGAQIRSVNHIKASKFARIVGSYNNTDGFNQTGEYACLSTDALPIYVYYAFGKQTYFTIKYKYNGEIATKQLKAVDYKTFKKTYHNRYIPRFKKDNQDYSFQYLDEKTGYLKVKTFAFDNNDSDYKTFLDSVFTELHQKNTPNLIVDVRGNGGGTGNALCLLYSYMSNRDFKENIDAYTIFDTVPLPQYFYGDKDALKNANDWVRKYLPNEKNGKFHQNQNYNPVWHPQPNVFKGHIYLLIDPFVASAASHFAAMLKAQPNTTTIGQTSMGGYYTHTGHFSITYELPNTGLRLIFSIVNVKQDVKKLPDQDFGEGVKPAYTIEETIDDYLNNIDGVLRFTKQLIQTRDKDKP